MRDPRGRYLDTKAITDLGPSWAHGCSKCKCGIVAAPPLTNAVATYLERLVQHIDGQITYCECRAGTRYRAFLLNRRQMLIEEARRHPLMVDAARQLTHPDIENARTAIYATYAAAPPPTVHGATELETEPA